MKIECSNSLLGNIKSTTRWGQLEQVLSSLKSKNQSQGKPSNESESRNSRFDRLNTRKSEFKIDENSYSNIFVDATEGITFQVLPVLRS